MPRYVVEREFNEGLAIAADGSGAQQCRGVTDNNLVQQVTWVHSYVSLDKNKTYCIYDAPTPEAIRLAARDNQLPISRITEVRVLDPYFYF